MRETNDIRANNTGGDGGWTLSPTRLKHCPPNFIDPATVIGCEALYWSAKKCWKGVGRKYSAQNYSLNIIANTLKLARELKSGKYKEGKTHIVKITYPKPRTALAIIFRDRVYQRSINDNALYSQMVRTFIYHNLACQKGKGTTMAREEFKKMLRKAFIKYGTNQFQILACDVKGYYDNMLHAETNRIVRKNCDPWTAERTIETLERQYRFHGYKGYNPGSQMVQIAGISYLNEYDHYVKEQMLRKLHLRYMDDTHTCGSPSENMEAIKCEMDKELNKVGLWLHPDKTKIARAADGVMFLGFIFKVTDTGKVLMFRDPAKVNALKRKMKRLAALIAKGRREIETMDECWECAKACMAEGNSQRLLKNMEQFVNQLKEDVRNAKGN